VSIVGTQPPASNGPASQPEEKLNTWQRWCKWWQLESPENVANSDSDADSLKTSKFLPLFSKLAQLIAPDKKMLSAACVFMVCAAMSELAIPHFATKAIFSAAGPGVTHATFEPTLKLLTGLICFYGFMSAARGYCFSILNNRMTMRLRAQLFANLVRREAAFFDGSEVGTLTSRLQADCQAVTKCVATNLNIAFRNMLQAVGGVVYLAMLSPSICMATLGVCILLWGITLFYGEVARRTQKVYQDTLAASNQVAEEVLSLSRVVRTFGTEGNEEGRYKSWLERMYSVGLRQATGYGMFVASGYIVSYMTKVVALALGCVSIMHGTMTAEQLTNFIFYVEFVTYASLSACDEVVEVMEAVGASERVLELLAAPPADQVAAGTTLPSFSGKVEFRDVSFRYPTRPNHKALDHVNLTLPAGKLVALVGLSGSGKTTLVALLGRLYDPNEGSILVDDTDLRSLDASWFRRHIGVVSQEPRLFGMSVRDNIAYGTPDATQADIEAAARDANAHDFITQLPKGYDTVVTDKLLSGGQKQRVALARALVRNPRLLILDEATSALDAESEAQVQGALDAAMAERKRTVVVIAHRLSTVRNADLTIVIDKGTIKETGTHAELMAAKGIYYSLVAKQAATADVLPPTAQVPSRPGGGATRLSPSPSASSLASVGGGNGNGASAAAAAYMVKGMVHASTASAEEDLLMSEVLRGMTSSDDTSHGRHYDQGSGACISASEREATLAAAAADAVTAENDLVSKTLGSQDPIDYASQGK